jgi:two-component system, OmpR family, sensor kinase
MSIRLRLTLLYTGILALTLMIFGAALYTIQSQSTLNALKRDLERSSERVARQILFLYLRPNEPPVNPAPFEQPAPVPFGSMAEDPAFMELREREIVRVLDASGVLVASPIGREQAALPLSAAGLRAVQDQQTWWQIGIVNEERQLVLSRPVMMGGKVVFIVQAARPLTEQERSVSNLSATLLAAGLVTLLIAFGVGWVIAGAALRPIHRITNTAQAIGEESDFSRRVDYHGPNDEVGRLATTFNSMLARLQDAYQRVSDALNLQRSFVADVSHELRTPLTTVRGNLALLNRQPPLPPDEQADILADMVDESDRLIRLVNDLLVLARADAGRSLVLEPLAVRPLVEEACSQARQLQPGRQISEDVPDLFALADGDALKQVLLIVLDNALKYSGDHIQVKAQNDGTQVVISIQDNGAGIDPDTLQHVFDRFYRGEGNLKTPGFGLGLSIARSLVEEQGGKIMIQSQAGKGSIVKIWLQAHKPAKSTGI